MWGKGKPHKVNVNRHSISNKPGVEFTFFLQYPWTSVILLLIRRNSGSFVKEGLDSECKYILL